MKENNYNSNTWITFLSMIPYDRIPSIRLVKRDSKEEEKKLRFSILHKYKPCVLYDREKYKMVNV